MSRTYQQGERLAVLADLRRRVARFEVPASTGAVAGAGHFDLGVAALGRHLPGGGLARAGLHEIVAGRAEDGASLAFAGFLAARRVAENRAIEGAIEGAWNGAGAVLWCVGGRGLYGPGLARLGLDPDRLLLALGRNDEERLWVMEEGLRCPGVAAVVAEIHKLDLKQSRRLQLAAEASGVTALLLRPWGAALTSGAALTRWRITSLPSLSAVGVPGRGIGRPGLKAELVRARGGRAAQWRLYWTPSGSLCEADWVPENRGNRHFHPPLDAARAAASQYP